MKPPKAVAFLSLPPADGALLAGLPDVLADNSFRPLLPSALTGSGWVLLGDEGCSDLADIGRWSTLPYVWLGWRTDTKQIPTAAIKVQAAAQVRDEGLTGKAAKVAIKDRIEMLTTECARRTTPNLAVVPVLWNTATGDLVVGTGKAVNVEAVRKAVNRTTGAYPEPVLPGDWSGARDRLWQVLTDAPAIGDDQWSGALAYEVGPAFLRWLWWKSEASAGELPWVDLGDGRKVSWVARSQIQLVNSRGDDIKVRAADALADPAVLASIVDGREVVSVGLRLDDENGLRIADLTLTVDGGDLAISGVSLGGYLERNTEDAAPALTELLVGLRRALGALLRRYAAAEGDPANRAQGEAALRRWLTGEVWEWTAKATADGRLVSA